MCSWIDTLLSLLSMAIGGVVTWLVAKIYYRRATRDLSQTAKDLREAVKSLSGIIVASGVHGPPFP